MFLAIAFNRYVLKKTIFFVDGNDLIGKLSQLPNICDLIGGAIVFW